MKRCPLCGKGITEREVPFYDSKEKKDYHLQCHKLLETVRENTNAIQAILNEQRGKKDGLE